MSTIDPTIIVTKKLTRELSLDFDEVVTDVDLTDIQMKHLNNLTVDFDSGQPKIAYLQNYAVNNVTLVNGRVRDGKLLDTVKFQLPLSAEGKSRNFYIRVDQPHCCNYTFVECDGITRFDIESNVDLKFKFDDWLVHPDRIGTYIFECYELKQHPTTMYIGSQNILSSFGPSTDAIRGRLI